MDMNAERAKEAAVLSAQPHNAGQESSVSSPVITGSQCSNSQMAGRHAPHFIFFIVWLSLLEWFSHANRALKGEPESSAGAPGFAQRRD